MTKLVRLPDPTGSQGVSQQSHSWSLRDLELLHHYMSCGCVGYDAQTPRYNIWTIEIAKLSFSYPYLLHQVLAVAALHLSMDQRDSAELATIAMQHRALALNAVQTDLSSNASNTSRPLFAFAGLTAIYAFGEVGMTRNQDDDSRDLVGKSIECFGLLRGITAIVKMHEEQIRRSWARDLISLDAREAFRLAKDMGMKFKHADALHEQIAKHTSGPESQDCAIALYCKEALQIAHDTYFGMIFESLSTVQLWFTGLSPFPVSKRFLEASAGPNGYGLPDGDPMGVEPDNYIIVEFSLTYGDDEAYEAIVTDFYETMNSAVMKKLEQRGLMGSVSPWLYINDADKGQDVWGGYPKENVEVLQRIRQKYDPDMVFTRSMPGGWKVADAVI